MRFPDSAVGRAYNAQVAAKTPARGIIISSKDDGSAQRRWLCDADGGTT